MTDRIVTGANGRKYITTEPQPHARTYTQAELDAALAEEREWIASWLATQRNDTPAQGREFAAALRALKPN